MREPKPKLLFFVTVDWFFCSHFLDRAVAAKQAGYEVVVLTSVGQHGEQVMSEGLRLVPFDIDRRSLNPIAALLALWRLVQVYRRERPDFLHHVALKPILLGTLAARMCGCRNVVNAVVGGGYAFTSHRLGVRLARPFLTLALRLLLNPGGSKVIFENADDLNGFVSQRIVRASDAVLIKGAGVEPAFFKPGGVAEGEPVVIMAARLLWDKGIGEFVEAARMLRNRGVTARFWIVGDRDSGNRACVDEATLSAWRTEGVVELLGYRNDIPELLEQASIACLPSYREGLPKFLLEAMAAGLPCVSTDVPGCREVVQDGNNGLLVPPRDASRLADAIEYLLGAPTVAKSMGAHGMARIEREFSSQRVIAQTLTLYREMQGE